MSEFMVINEVIFNMSQAIVIEKQGDYIIAITFVRGETTISFPLKAERDTAFKKMSDQLTRENQ